MPIVGAKADLDVSQIRDSLTLLEDALGQSDLLPIFEDILKASPR